MAQGWLWAYVDDITVRTGRVLDGVWYTDEEYAERTRKAAGAEKKHQWQAVEDALEAQGFLPDGLGSELSGRGGVELPKGKAKPRPKRSKNPLEADRNDPYAHPRANFFIVREYDVPYAVLIVHLANPLENFLPVVVRFIIG